MIADGSAPTRPLVLSSDFQVKQHMHKLEELEYVLVHRGGRGQSFVYELLYDDGGRDGRPFLMGLIGIDALKNGYDGKKEHAKPELEYPRSIQSGPVESASSSTSTAENGLNAGTSRSAPTNGAEIASMEPARQITSYAQSSSSLAASLAAAG
jgi:hypothetical protein